MCAVAQKILKNNGKDRSLQAFLSGGYISYYTTVRGSDILRNVTVSGYVTFYKIN